MASNSHRLRFNFWLDMNKPEEELIADKIEVLKNERSFTSVIRDGIRLICDLREGKLDVLFELFPWVRVEFLEYMREVAPKPSEPEHPKSQPAETNQQIEAERAWLEAEKERIEQERAWEERHLEKAKQALETERQQMAEERQRIEAERMKHQTHVEKQLERLEKLLLHQGNQPIEPPAVGLQASGAGGFQSIGGQPDGIGLKGIKSKTTFEPPPFDDDDDMPTLKIEKARSDGSATQNFLNSLNALQQQ